MLMSERNLILSFTTRHAHIVHTLEYVMRQIRTHGCDIMIQWMIKKTIKVMGTVYVILDSFLKNEGGPILGIQIDDDFDSMDRKELCKYIEEKFGWKENEFWNLESTQKIRVCCQIARDNNFVSLTKDEER